ncbi:AIPR family protein [Coleofasciculus sp. FACHB-712]|uniref:AIPR family protein n=1 Tax=Coleofasciculus sp. FACHB-712 TaxID=2692789 RepID=UPI001683A77E|nr:AIPR family protein [Coleofasciculus sp. FACHB-712]MBD1945740.1 AIPR family protein [Coleofasciculus sp. FACHB-712]
MSEAGLDRITKDFIKKFMQAYEIEQVNENKDFEKFSVYCAVKQDYTAHLEGEDLDNLFVGSGSDTGIDGLGIIVENQLIEDIDEIDDIIGKKDNVQIVFIFVQSTTTKRFNPSKFRDFTIGVKEFFYDYAKPDQRKTKRRNANIDKKAKVASQLLEKTSIMLERPVCKLYYFMGNDIENRLGINTDVVESEKESILLELNIFGRVDIEVRGTNYLHNLYRKTLAKPKVQISFPRKVSLPQIDDINASYMGILPFSEFKKLIIDENSGNIRNVFEDNVRYFNEKFPTNRKIKETIENGNLDRFFILNNGITIVTNKLTSSADYITLEDYQIVNGCQTSNILYQCRNYPGIDNLYLTLKIIHTENQAIANDITIATNNQTTVTYEALNSLLKFHKDLEIYYSSRAYTVEREQIYLYYGRQEGKYERDINVEAKSRIISVMNQAKYYAAMFLDVPYESSAFRARIKKKIDEQIVFKEGQPFEPYYTSAVVHYELHKYLKNSRNEQNEFNIYRFHILMLFKYLVLGAEVNNSAPEKIKDYCEKMISVVQGKNKFVKIVTEAIEIIGRTLNTLPEQEGMNKTANFVQTIKAAAKSKYPQGMF